MRRNTALNKDFSSHDAFLLHFPSRWEEPGCSFSCKHGTKFLPATARWGPGSSCSRRAGFVSQHSTDVVQTHGDRSLAPSHANMETAKRVVLGEPKQALHTFRTEMRQRTPLPQKHHASKSSWVIQQSASSSQQFGYFELKKYIIHIYAAAQLPEFHHCSWKLRPWDCETGSQS